MTTELLSSRTPAKAPPAPRGLVLIVDDEEQNRALLRDTLELHGYEIEEAENGEQTLDQIARRAPDVLLLDVMMPGLNGFEVCRRLKSSAETAPIQILMVTALSERKERMMGIAAGANDFLNKPVDREDLILRVRNAVQTRLLSRQLQREKEKCQRLLANLLPSSIAQRMMHGDTEIAECHPDATVLAAGLAGFSGLSAVIGPSQMVLLLNEIFCAFDDLVERHGLEKIRTGGDTYTVAGGLFAADPAHTREVVQLACKLHEAVRVFNAQYRTCVDLRVGIGTGRVFSGVIGRKHFAYDLWGTPVEVARALQAAGEAGSTHVDDATYQRVKEACLFADPLPLQARAASPLLGRKLNYPVP